ncbi:TetR/AcrR family transcriptional regulator [soil metagenome]
MSTIKKSKGRGRPRGFDPEQAIATAQALFHEHGYDGVGIAALTQALGINPPSFYAAFGSKAQLFDRVLARYSASGLPIDDLLVPGRPPDATLGALLEVAARTYAADPRQRGCLVLESARDGHACESVACAGRLKAASRERLRAFVAVTHPAQADAVSDYMVATMSSLSACAREGWDAKRLLAVADLAKAGLAILS